jgi:hypothetical protein
MESIRATGGSFGLKSIDETKTSNSANKSLGYDYRKELVDHLAKRREGKLFLKRL